MYVSAMRATPTSGASGSQDHGLTLRGQGNMFIRAYTVRHRRRTLGRCRVAIIDVDTHLESGPGLAAQFCDAVGGSLPHCPELRALMFAGELLRVLPPD